MTAYLLQRLVGRAPRSEPVRTIQEIRLKDRLQDQQGRHLHYPVAYRRNPQRPQLPIRVRNVHALHRLRRVVPRPQLFLDSFQKSRCALFCPHDLFDRDAIHPRRSLIPAHPFPSRFQHIHPIDPVVQRIKPELRFLLGLLAQLLSQLRNLLRQSWLLRRSRLRRCRRCPSLRSGIFIQAGFSSSYRFMLPVRPLRSAGVPPPLRYYGPLRLPTGPPRRLCLPVARWSPLLPPCGASQAPRLIFSRALSPTTPEGPTAACACCFAAGFWLHPSRRTGHIRIPIEAESGSLALRLTGSPPESAGPSLEPSLVRLHAEQAIYMVNSFQFTRSARLILAYRPSGSGSCRCIVRASLTVRLTASAPRLVAGAPRRGKYRQLKASSSGIQTALEAAMIAATQAATASATLFRKCRQFGAVIDRLERDGSYQRLYRVEVTGGLDHRITVWSPFRRAQQEMICFDSNSYLGLHLHPRVIAAVRAALDRVGYGTPTAQLLCGSNSYLKELEETVSQYHGREDTMVFPSGYAANLCAITALIGAGDLILCDQFSHASIHDAARAARTRHYEVYPHGDLERLAALLAEAPTHGRPIAPHRVFRMNGDG